MLSVGHAFLIISCNLKDNVFEVEPLMIWNNELDEIQKDLKKGTSRWGQNTDSTNILLYQSSLTLSDPHEFSPTIDVVEEQ